MSAPKKLYVQCNPLLDISSHVDKDFLAKYKIEAPAGLCTDEQKGIYADLESRSDVVYVPGGAGLNTARVAQWMSQAEKKTFVTYVGCVADDKHGAQVKSMAEDNGVTMAVQNSKTNPTGTCAVCIVEKERYMVANLAAANDITGEHLDTPEVMKAIKEAEYFYFTGFTLTINVDYVLKVAKQAALNNAIFTWNLAAPFLIQFFADPMAKVLPYVDILFSNDEEADLFAEQQKWDDLKGNTLEIAKKAANLPKETSNPRLVVFTCGAKNTVWATPTESGTVAVEPIEASKIVDTNAAGDSFVGGFLAAKAMGKSVEDSIKAGNYAAGVVIQHDGCTFPEKPTFAL